MRILSILNLAPKRSIALIEVLDQWMVVGIGTDNITLISKVDRPEEDSDMQTEEKEEQSKFHSILQKINFKS